MSRESATRPLLYALRELVREEVARVIEGLQVGGEPRRSEWLTLEEARLLLRVSDSTIRRWKRSGVLPTRRVGRRVLAHSADVQALARPVEIRSSVKTGAVESASDPEVERVWERLTRKVS